MAPSDGLKVQGFRCPSTSLIPESIPEAQRRDERRWIGRRFGPHSVRDAAEVTEGERTSPAQLPRVSATVRATKFPCIEYVFYFAQRETVMPDGFWYVNISVQSEPRTFVFEREK
jgi:hypothetical protein